MTAVHLLLLLAACFVGSNAFDYYKYEHLIPSDGYHDLLGLVPFWVKMDTPDDLRRSEVAKRDNLPSSWETLTSQTSGSKDYIIQGRCPLQGEFSADSAILKTKKTDKCEKPSMKMVFDKVFPKIDVLQTTQQLINPDQFFIDSLEINKATKEVTVKVKAKESWRLLSGDNFVLASASVTLTFKAGEPVEGIKSWGIRATGKVGVSAHSLDMTIEKPRDEDSLPFKWKIDSLLMVDIMGIFGITLTQLNMLSVGFDTTKLGGVTFENPDCTGQIDFLKDTSQRTSETFQIVCKASISNSQAIKNGDVYLILTRAKGKVATAAVVIDAQDTINIQEALENFMSEGSFISDFSMLGRIERNCIIMISKEEVSMVKNKALMALVSPFITEYDTKEIPAGVNVRVMIPLKGNMRKDCKVELPKEVPETLAVTITLKAGGLSFSFPKQFKSDMPKFLKCLDPQIKAELPYQLFPPSGGPIDIKEITIAAGRYFKITVVLKGPFVFLGGKINISDFEVSISKQKGDDLKITGVTTISLGPLSVGLTLEKQGNKYSFSAYVETFTLARLHEMIGENNLLDFVSLLGNLKDFGIKDFKLVKEFGAGNEHKKLRVAGRPILWGMENVYIEGLVWKPRAGTTQPAKAIAIGIIIEGIRLDKIMERIFGSNLFSVAWFSEMTALIIISNANGKAKSKSDKKGKANEVGTAAADKSKAGRSLVYLNDEYSHQRYTRELNPLFGHLKSLRKRGTKRSRTLRPRYASNLKSRFIGNGLLGHVANPVMRSYGGHGAALHNNRILRANDFAKRAKAKSDSSKSEKEGKKEDGKEEEDEEGEVKFSVPYLSDRDIEKGVTFVGIFNIPQDNGCFGDSLCLWLAEKVGKDATIEISGTIFKKGFKLGAKFAGTIPVTADGSLAMQSMELQLSLIGKDSSLKLACTLYWNIPSHVGSGQVQFIGSIEVGLAGKLSLSFSMAGMWRNPFNNKYLAIGNMHLSVGISVGPGGVLPTLAFGATVWIGMIKSKGSNDHAIKISVYFGIDFNKPSDSYFYGSINKLTLDAIFKAFELGSPSMPRAVRESGFPEGMTVSYSLQGTTIDDIDLNIQPGFYLKGTINIFGFKVKAEINIDPLNGKFLIDVSLSPIDWAGGLIQLRKNEADRVNGPKAFIYLKPDSITVQIEGYISLLGISKYIYIDISDTAFKFNMKTDLWGIIKSELYVEAAYGNLAALHFEFRANVIVDMKKVFEIVKKYLNKAADIAKNKLQEAQNKVTAAKSKLVNAKKKMDGWKESINAYQNRLKKRSAEIEEAKKKLQTDCKAKCGTVCVPFLDWKPRCWKVWWWWVGCPYWNSCRWRAPNLICIAGCEINKVAKKFVAWAEQVGIKIMIGLSEIGKGLIDVGKGFVSLAEGVLDIANGVLKFISDAVEIGRQIMNKMLAWAGDNLFNIELLELRGKLTSDFKACVGITCKFVLFGVKADFGGDICVNLKFWESVSSSAVEKENPGTKKMINDVPEMDAKLNSVNSHITTLDEKEKSVDTEVNSKTSEKIKRDYVPTAEEMYYKKLAEEPLPKVVTRGASTVNAFKTGAPWVLIQDFDSKQFDHTPFEDENIPAEKRTLDEDWNAHHSTPCVQIRKIVNKYTTIADGLASLHAAMANVRENYQATKRTMEQGVDNLEYEVRSTEMKHNMTHEERGDLYHWYKEAKDGLEKWDTKAKAVLSDEHDLMLPRFRSQIEHIMRKENKKSFSHYMNELHEIGRAAYKRSDIPANEGVEAAEELHKIKKDLIELVQSDESNLLAFGSKVRSIQSNIRGLKRSLKRCK